MMILFKQVFPQKVASKLVVVKLIVITLLLTLATTFLYNPIVLAQSTTANGITITPPTQNISITVDQASYRLTIILTNNTDSEVNLDMSAQDFGALEEGGGLLFLGTESNTKWENHRLAKWMDIKPKNLKLDPHEQAEVVVEIKNDDTLTPGGHYSAVMATLASREKQSNVAINQSLSSLLFINKVGGESYKLEAEAIDPQIAWWGQVDGAAANLTNTGNTHVIPRGTLSLHDPLNRTVAKGIVNQESAILLPGTEDSFNSSLEQTDLPLWPGMYTLVLAYRYDGQDSVVSVEKQVFSIGIVTAGVLVVTTTAAIAWLIKRNLPRFRLGN